MPDKRSNRGSTPHFKDPYWVTVWHRRLGKDGRIVIPAQVRKVLGLTAGTTVGIQPTHGDDDGVVVWRVDDR